VSVLLFRRWDQAALPATMVVVGFGDLGAGVVIQINDAVRHSRRVFNSQMPVALNRNRVAPMPQ